MRQYTAKLSFENFCILWVGQGKNTAEESSQCNQFKLVIFVGGLNFLWESNQGHIMV